MPLPARKSKRWRRSKGARLGPFYPPWPFIWAGCAYPSAFPSQFKSALLKNRSISCLTHGWAKSRDERAMRRYVFSSSSLLPPPSSLTRPKPFNNHHRRASPDFTSDPRPWTARRSLAILTRWTADPTPGRGSRRGPSRQSCFSFTPSLVYTPLASRRDITYSQLLPSSSFRAAHLIPPLHTQGQVLLTPDGERLVTTTGEEVLLTELQTGRRLGRVQSVSRVVLMI